MKIPRNIIATVLLGAMLLSSTSCTTLPKNIKSIPNDIKEITYSIADKENIPYILGSAAAIGGALLVDDSVRDYFTDEQPLEDVDEIANDYLGRGELHVISSIGMYAVGEMTENAKLSDTGIASLEAFMFTGVTTLGLKYIVGRERPGDGDNTSFPSGHVSSTAAIAGTISAMYDWDWRVSLPLYVITAFVAASRLNADAHYFSDVVAGAAIGTGFGILAARLHKNKESSWRVMPLHDGKRSGLMVSVDF